MTSERDRNMPQKEYFGAQPPIELPSSQLSAASFPKWTIHPRWSWRAMGNDSNDSMSLWVTKYRHIVPIYEFDKKRFLWRLRQWHDHGGWYNRPIFPGSSGSCDLKIATFAETFGQERAQEVRHHRPGRAPKNFKPSQSKSLQAESQTCLPWTSLHAQCKKKRE